MSVLRGGPDAATTTVTCSRCRRPRAVDAECGSCLSTPDPTLGGLLGPLPKMPPAVTREIRSGEATPDWLLRDALAQVLRPAEVEPVVGIVPLRGCASRTAAAPCRAPARRRCPVGEPVRCSVCGKTGCPSAEDPVTGPMVLHNAAAWAELQQRRVPAPAGPVLVREELPCPGCVGARS